MAEKNIVQTERIEEIEVTEDGDVNGLILLSEIATITTPGIASFDSEDFAITEDGHVYVKQKVGAIQYIGLPERYSDTSNTENLIWSVNVELSPKKRVEIVRNDLIMASSSIEEFGVIVGDVFKVLSTIDGKILTDVKREFSIRGPQGERGFAATIKAGTVTILQSNQDAKVTNSGTENDAVFDFEIPRGYKGDVGPGFEIKYHVDSTDDLPEPTYDNCGDVYSVGEGEAPYDVYICEWTGDAYEWVNHGPLHGPKGDPATVDVYETITTEPGTDAEVTNVTGDSNNVQLQFKIPRGVPATVKVVKTETIDPSEDARVVDVNSSENDAEFEFYIPQGKTGEASYIDMEVINGELWCNSCTHSNVEGFKLNGYGELIMEVSD